MDFGLSDLLNPALVMQHALKENVTTQPRGRALVTWLPMSHYMKMVMVGQCSPRLSVKVVTVLFSKKLAIIYFIPNYVLNNLANSIDISLEKTEEEWEYTINQMRRRTSDREGSCLKSKWLPNASCTKGLII